MPSNSNPSQLSHNLRHPEAHYKFAPKLDNAHVSGSLERGILGASDFLKGDHLIRSGSYDNNHPQHVGVEIQSTNLLA